jgi:Flp pilus assembly protein protease CpaA
VITIIEVDILTSTALICGIIATYTDIKDKYIPNWLIGIGIITSIILCLFYYPSRLFFRAIVSICFFVIFLVFVFLNKKRFGMGDVNFIALISFSYEIVGTWIVLMSAFPFAPFLTLGMLVALPR